MIPDLSVAELIIVLLITATGSIVQGSAGIGLGLVASPVLIAIDDRFAPGPLLFVGLVIGARHIFSERSHLDRPTLGRALIGLPFGAVAGGAVLGLMSPSLLALTIGLLVALAALCLLLGFTLPRSPRSDVLTGALCAFTSLTAALPGPPLVVGFHDLPPGAMRSTVSMFVAAISAVALGALLWLDRFGSYEVRLLLLLVPPVLVGLWASRWTRPLLDRSWFRPAVLVLSLLGGVALAAKQLFP